MNWANMLTTVLSVGLILLAGTVVLLSLARCRWCGRWHKDRDEEARCFWRYREERDRRE